MPDAACQGLTMATTFYAANTAQPLPYSFAQSFDQIAAAHQQSLGRFAPENLYVRLHTLQANEGVSNLLLLSLVGTYAGGILIDQLPSPCWLSSSSPMPASSGGAFKLPSTWVWRQRTGTR